MEVHCPKMKRDQRLLQFGRLLMQLQSTLWILAPYIKGGRRLRYRDCATTTLVLQDSLPDTGAHMEFELDPTSDFCFHVNPPAYSGYGSNSRH